MRLRELERRAKTGSRDDAVRYMRELARTGALPQDSEAILLLARLGEVPRWLADAVFGEEAMVRTERRPGRYLSAEDNLMVALWGDVGRLEAWGVEVPEARTRLRREGREVAKRALTSWVTDTIRDEGDRGDVLDAVWESADLDAATAIIHDAKFTEDHLVPGRVVEQCTGEDPWGGADTDAGCIEEVMGDMGSELWSFQPEHVEANLAPGGWWVRGTVDDRTVRDLVTSVMRDGIVLWLRRL